LYLLFIGFESLIQENLDDVSKRFVDTRELSDLVRTIQNHRIGIHGSFIFGFDGDDRTVFKRTVEFVQRNNIELPTFSILTPFRALLSESGWKKREGPRPRLVPLRHEPCGLQTEEVKHTGTSGGISLGTEVYLCPRSILKRLLWGPKHNFLYFLMSNFVLREPRWK
jgi:radical SAM superfamily enzyme YgiQ (UPF0313 family)